jgi:formamidopyrimidine-DNA glycosylase
MPELPEVETVRSGLEKILRGNPVIKRVLLLRKDLRFPIPSGMPRAFAGQAVVGIRRRAKYLLFDTEKVILLSHLGMTGSWRLLSKNESPGKHDHCLIEFDDGRILAYRDPRRFGLIDLIKPGEEAVHPRLKSLGVEPLHDFSVEFLFTKSRKRKVPIKVLLMDQKIVAGIGNIYASEILFQAGVRPTRPSSSLKWDECERVVAAVGKVLRQAIGAGGSSIRDYRTFGGGEGSFQAQHLVYERAGEACKICETPIKSKIFAGRSTYWCPRCQN